jgi:hypothetical protein
MGSTRARLREFVECRLEARSMSKEHGEEYFGENGLGAAITSEAPNRSLWWLQTTLGDEEGALRTRRDLVS